MHSGSIPAIGEIHHYARHSQNGNRHLGASCILLCLFPRGCSLGHPALFFFFFFLKPSCNSEATDKCSWWLSSSATPPVWGQRPSRAVLGYLNEMVSTHAFIHSAVVIQTIWQREGVLRTASIHPLATGFFIIRVHSFYTYVLLL